MCIDAANTTCLLRRLKAAVCIVVLKGDEHIQKKVTCIFRGEASHAMDGNG